jgi:hypothetical protein
MKPVKITAEITLTPEMFSEWNEGILPETELMYQQYVEKMLYSTFGFRGDGDLYIGEYGDFINKTIDDNGLILTVEELK